jgi:L-asparaginase II
VSVELVEVVRSGFREGVHRGSLVVLAADGSVDLALGDVRTPVFPRSSNKPMQAVAMLRSGFAPRDTTQLALSSASHSGEAAHVEGALRLLAEAGLTEDDLRCPADLPGDEPTREALLAAGGGRRRVYMNCSGKHSAMVSTCAANGWSLPDYLDPAHPLQQSAVSTVAELAGEAVDAVGVDGCGAPIFALSLTGLATAFARIVTAPAGSPERRVADAVRAHPFLVSGTGREDLLLMAAVPGLLCKAGAEGVHAGALPDGRAFAVKIDDGAGRARGPVTVGVLRHLGVPDSDALASLAEEPLLGGGLRVGSARLLPGLLQP